MGLTFEEDELKIEPTKSSLILFTPWTSPRELTPTVTINGIPLEVEKQLKILGVILSRHGCYSHHVVKILKEC